MSFKCPGCWRPRYPRSDLERKDKPRTLGGIHRNPCCSISQKEWPSPVTIYKKANQMSYILELMGKPLMKETQENKVRTKEADRSYPFSTLLLTFWWLANWLTLLSSVQPPLHSVFSNFSSQIREKEGHRSGLLSQDEGWLSIFPQPEIPPFSSSHSLPHQHTGRIRQWEHLHWSWFQPVGQGLRPGQTWRGNCRDLVPKKTFELGKDTGVCNLKLRGPAAIATMNQRWDKLQTFLLKSLGQNLSPHLRPWAREKDTHQRDEH